MQSGVRPVISFLFFVQLFQCFIFFCLFKLYVSGKNALNIGLNFSGSYMERKHNNLRKSFTYHFSQVNIDKFTQITVSAIL